MDVREHWRSVYVAKRPSELSWFEAGSRSSLAALDRVGATPAMALVDVGAGASTLVDALLDRGWKDLTVLEVAEPALDATRLRLDDRGAAIRWEVADVLDWRPDRSFDIWHDRAVFHFLISQEDRAAYKRALLQATRQGSHAIIATFALDGPETCSGLPVQRYSAAALAAEFSPEFQLLDAWSKVHVTPWGAEQHFQWVALARR